MASAFGRKAANPEAIQSGWFATTLGYMFVLVAALVPRVLGLGRFITADEASFWVRRSEAFMRALETHDYAATAISVHPGVTTMWLGGAGMLLRRALGEYGWLGETTFATNLAFEQLPVALVNGAVIVLGYMLLRHLLPPVTALLAALLWAADPFTVAYDRVLHVDGLAGSFATLALLAACCYWYHHTHPGFLILSGVSAALGVLSKTPAFGVVPVVALIAFMSWRQRPAPRRLRELLWSLAIWAGIATITAFVLWPALWAAPMRVLALIDAGVELEGGRPHQRGNFFLGRPYGDEDPGLLFYPLVLALRTTPLSLVGLLLLPLAFWRLTAAQRRGVVALVAFVVLFVVALSVFPKKFNRYLVPAFPSVDILAAIGFAYVGGLLPSGGRDGDRPQPLAWAGAAVVAVLALGNAASWHPYELAAFNQVLGGAAAGERAFQVGWGEGYEQAADWLNTQPDITGVVVATQRTEMLQPYMRGGAQVTAPLGPDALPDQSGYVVVYIRDVQGGSALPPFDQFFGRQEPLHTVEIEGVPYAWIYQVPPPVAQRRPADLGDRIHLRGYAIDGEPRAGTQMTLNLFWGTSAQPPVDYNLFVHLIGADGKRYVQVDPPLETSNWGANRFVTTPIPIVLPHELPSGTYYLDIGLYNVANGQRLPVAGYLGDRLDNGPGSLDLAQIVVP